MDTKNLPTKNNLIKIKHSIKQSKEGQILLEQKKMILQKELEKYSQQRQQLKQTRYTTARRSISCLKNCQC